LIFRGQSTASLKFQTQIIKSNFLQIVFNRSTTLVLQWRRRHWRCYVCGKTLSTGCRSSRIAKRFLNSCLRMEQQVRIMHLTRSQMQEHLSQREMSSNPSKQLYRMEIGRGMSTVTPPLEPDLSQQCRRRNHRYSDF
jgi:hypothetical protein